eukprot:scaffold2030_cov388-Prasinococcus_capsulatus_cf.AAC.5
MSSCCLRISLAAPAHKSKNLPGSASRKYCGSYSRQPIGRALPSRNVCGRPSKRSALKTLAACTTSGGLGGNFASSPEPTRSTRCSVRRKATTSTNVRSCRTFARPELVAAVCQFALRLRLVLLDAADGRRQVEYKLHSVTSSTLTDRFLSGVRYGIYAYYYFPPSQVVLHVCQPLLSLTGAIPFGHMIPWFAIYLGVVIRPTWNRFVRWNGLQALLLDLLIVFPGLVLYFFPKIPFKPEIFTLIFTVTVGAIAFCAVRILMGEKPRLGAISNAVDVNLQ